MITPLIKETRTRLGAHPKDKDDVLKMAASLLAADQGAVGIPEEEILKLLVKREELGSTGIGEGIAIPHATIPGASEITIALITIPEGINFNSIDRKPVRAVFAMCAPPDKRADHVRNLAELSRLVKNPGFLKALTGASSFEEVLRALGADGPAEEPQIQTTRKSLLWAVVQKPEFLEPLLEVLTGMTSAEAVVFDAHGSGRYLQALPLFASFWSGEERRTAAKVVMAVINRHDGNEIVRRISSSITDPAREEGLLLALQELSLVTGNLEL